jgi:tetratricopeptide (TPR) repeat protein
MHIYILIVASFLLIYSPALIAQESQQGRWENIEPKYQDLFFKEALYANHSIFHRSEKLHYTQAVQSAYPRLDVNSFQFQLISDFRAGKNGALDALENFASKKSNHPELWPTHFELGTYYYNQKAYQLSINSFNKVNPNSLSNEEWMAYHFKKGYCHFVQKEFAQAASAFNMIKDLKSDFFFPSNYYSGMCSYFEGDYEQAVQSFQLVSSSALYRPMIPYYLTQIYFAQGEFDRLIPYGEDAILQTETQNIKGIRLLLGQAYYKKNQFDLSLPHLEYYEENTVELTQEEFYQLAFTQYQLSLYDRAIENFEELTFLDSKIGQVASYYLADCYQRSNDLSSARAAYKKVSQMPFLPSMREEAHFNYGKLSAELNYDREAINTLIKIETESRFFNAAQDIINDVLNSTDDYTYALETIEKLPKPITQKLKATYQGIAFKLAIMAVVENHFDQARDLFKKVETYSIDQRKIIESYFWLAQMLHQEGKYTSSITAFRKYFDQLNGPIVLSKEASPFMGHYSQAYNYMKTENYRDALKHFNSTITALESENNTQKKDALLDLIVDDTYVRSGDCYFKLRAYREAKAHYEEAIIREASNKVYAMFQKGLIEGLLEEPYEKVLTMQDIIRQYPQDEYADDALMQLGEVYLSLGSSYNAKEAFSKLVDQYGKHSVYTNKALLKIGLIDYNQGAIQSALTAYKQVFKNQPNAEESQQAIRALEEIYVEDLGQAKQYFEYMATLPGFELDDFTKDSLEFKVGLLQYERAQYEAAINQFSRYLSNFENGYFKLPAHYYRGESNASIKAYSKALLDYESIIQSEAPKYFLSSLRKAAIISFNHVKDYQKAYIYYDQMLNNTADKELMHEAKLGALTSAFRANDIDGVTKYREKILRSEASNAYDKTNAEFYFAKMNQMQGNVNVAMKAFRTVAQSSKNEEGVEARFRIAELLYQQDQLQEAEEQCLQNNKEMGSYSKWIAKNLLLLSDIYLKRDQILNARAAVEAVLENFTDSEAITSLAQEKLQNIEAKADALNRIKTPSKDGNLELDTSRRN